MNNSHDIMFVEYYNKAHIIDIGNITEECPTKTPPSFHKCFQ